MRFVTIFPESMNVHLTKDVGMIPFIMHKYYGYDATVVTYRNQDTYTYLENEVKGLKIDYIHNVFGNPTVDTILYLLRNAKKIDVLNVFHFNLRSLYWTMVYKLINHKGIVYLKLDANNTIKEYNFQKKGLKSYIRNEIVRRIDIISVETMRLHEYIRKQWQIPVVLIPNGFYDEGKRVDTKYSQKKNVILTVGRIGSKEKNNEVLLEGFANAFRKGELSGWSLRLVGTIETSFKPFIESYFLTYPELVGKVIFTGPIYDRALLYNEYKEAKIFCLTSIYEGFALVLLEAIQHGCYVVTSNVEPAEDITGNGQFGSIFPIKDVGQLADTLISVCNNETRIEESCSEIQDFAYETFYWPKICEKIDSFIRGEKNE